MRPIVLSIHRFTCFFLLITSLILTIRYTPVYAGEITIAASDYPPYSYVQNARITGFSSEVVSTLLENAGITAQIKVYPWQRAYRMGLETPNVLIFPIARLPQREALFKWIGTISPAQTYLFKLRSRQDIVVSNLIDAVAYRIGCVKDDFTQDYLTAKGIHVEVVNQKEALNIRMLANGRLDLIPFTELAFIQRVRGIGLRLELFEKAFHLGEISQDFYLAASEETPDEIVSKLREALMEIKQTGTYQQILDRYIMPIGK